MPTESRDPLTANYDSWTEGARRGARWLALVLAGIAAVVLDQLELMELLKSDTKMTTVGLSLVVAGVSVVIVSVYVAQSDAYADIGYQTRKSAAALAEKACEKHLIVCYLPLDDLTRWLNCPCKYPLPSDLRVNRRPGLECNLPKLLHLQQRLHLRAGAKESSLEARWAMIVDDAVDQLRARSTFDRTRARLSRALWGFLGGSVLAGLGFGILVVVSTQ